MRAAHGVTTPAPGPDLGGRGSWSTSPTATAIRNLSAGDAWCRQASARRLDDAGAEVADSRRRREQALGERELQPSGRVVWRVSEMRPQSPGR